MESRNMKSLRNWNLAHQNRIPQKMESGTKQLNPAEIEFTEMEFCKIKSCRKWNPAHNQ